MVLQLWYNDMGFNAINPDATIFYRGVINRSGGRGGLRSFQTVKDPVGIDSFVAPFKLPETPDLPTIKIGESGTGGAVGITYTAPTFTIAANPVSLEAGSTANIIVTPNWTQNDAGTPNSFAVALQGETGYTGTAPIVHTFNNVEFRDAVRTVSVTLGYTAGLIKQDGLGVTVPGNITAGSLTRTVDFRGYRKAFWGTSAVKGSAPTTSAAIRALTGSPGECQRSFIVPILAGAYDLVFAAPVALGNHASVMLGGFEQGAAFVRTQVMVEGVNGFTPTMYNVWFNSAVLPFATGSFSVTITT